MLPTRLPHAYRQMHLYRLVGPLTYDHPGLASVDETSVVVDYIAKKFAALRLWPPPVGTRGMRSRAFRRFPTFNGHRAPLDREIATLAGKIATLDQASFPTRPFLEGPFEMLAPSQPQAMPDDGLDLRRTGAFVGSSS